MLCNYLSNVIHVNFLFLFFSCWFSTPSRTTVHNFDLLPVCYTWANHRLLLLNGPVQQAFWKSNILSMIHLCSIYKFLKYHHLSFKPLYFTIIGYLLITVSKILVFIKHSPQTWCVINNPKTKTKKITI